MNKGWLELESDPGLFTLLLEDIGVRGVQVEEIYDLQKALEGPVYGFIFLFKWIEERRARRKIIQEQESFVMDDQIVTNMFFAKQVIPNSCATHALLSVMLNCNTLPLGDTLTKLKDFCKDMGPEEKGHAIGNMPDLAKAHNSHARSEQRFIPEKEKQQGISTTKTAEAFHFVSYVPINGRLFELDGLKPYPIDHGPWGENEEWTERFRQVISDRLGMATGGEPYHDIRFNLMAVVPCRRQQLEHKLTTLKTNRQIVLEALQQMVKVTEPIPDEEKKLKTEMDGDGQTEPLAVRVSQRLLERRNSGVVMGMGKLPAFLDVHDYAKSPIRGSQEDDDMDVITVDTAGDVPDPNVDMGGIGESLNLMPVLADIDIARIKRNELHNDDSVKISIAVREDGSLSIPITVASTDVTKPLSIRTQFGKKQVQFTDGGETTDTASEGGTPCSSVNSSPNFKAQARQALRGADDTPVKIPTIPEELRNHKDEVELKVEPTENIKVEIDEEFVAPEEKPSPFSKHQGFTPKDLLDLLKNVESEIKSSEAKLQDEVEKRKRYKIDDCRRTHNYDQFICTFLSMLAEQGHLAELVEDQLIIKRRQGVNIGKLQKSKKANNNRKRSRSKKKR
ncbi:ubiquitin carboxyl-terminal hydrolase BAP1-like isoform X2 [Lineus longissimus]|uniref:ubiquitin carboxyl-terminal hydrolase BAP1-like isoform X2 n=1 Tax=Lineus longissimus TaxID=88925 RepID=UPI002B4DCBA1